MKTIYLFITMSLFINIQTYSQSGTVKNEIIISEALANNKLGDSPQQEIAIYLPPSYESSFKSYPVIYFLPGFGDQLAGWVDGFYFKLQSSMDDLISTGKINELIMVICPGRNLLGGCFYVNSEVTGNWDDFITEEVVSFVDKNYRTLDNRDSRAITGHSMGGFGALNLSMLHPDVFGMCYALSPGVFNEEEAMCCQLFANDNLVMQMAEDLSESDAATLPEMSVDNFRNKVNLLFQGKDWNQIFSYAYSCTFSGNMNKPVPHIDYPFFFEDGVLKKDSVVMTNFDNGYGNWKDKVTQYRSNLKSLKGLFFEYGINDQYKWIPEGCCYLDSLLNVANIGHTSISFEGGHQNIVSSRLKDHAIVTLAKLLEYDNTKQ